MAINAGFDTSPVPRTNPYLDEIDAATQNAHAQLSPGAQEALKRAGAPVGIQAQQQPQGIQNPPARPIPTLAPQRQAMDETLPNGQPAMMAGTGIHMPTAPAMPLPGGTRGNAANNFNTTLSPGEEPQFQNWKSQYAPHDSGEDYDLRGAYKYGLTPSAENGHWSDRFKKPNEPTFSNESQYAQDAPDKAGRWNGDTYVPPAKAAITNPPQARAPIQPVPQTAAAGPAQAEMTRLAGSKAGVDQIHNPWGRIPLQILAGIGETFAPRLAQALPGTWSHHNMLLGQAEGAVAQQEDIRKSQEQAQKEASEENLQGGQTAHAYAQADTLTNPQDKIATNEIELFQKDPNAWAQFHALAEKAAATKEPQFIKDGEGNIVGMIDPDMKVHSASDPNLDPQAKAIMEAAKPKPKTGEESTDIKNYNFAVTQGYKGSFEQWQKDEANRKAVRPPAETGTWSLQEGPGGKPVLMNSHTGEMKAAPEGLQPRGTEAKTAPERDALTYAENYIKGGRFTASGDEALMDQFFALAKPKRMNAQQNEILMKGRDAIQGLKAQAKHLMSPDAPYFDDTQRQNIVQTMRNLGASQGTANAPQAGGNTGGPAATHRYNPATGKIEPIK